MAKFQILFFFLFTILALQAFIKSENVYDETEIREEDEFSVDIENGITHDEISSEKSETRIVPDHISLKENSNTAVTNDIELNNTLIDIFDKNFNDQSTGYENNKDEIKQELNFENSNNLKENLIQKDIQDEDDTMKKYTNSYSSNNLDYVGQSESREPLNKINKGFNDQENSDSINLKAQNEFISKEGDLLLKKDMGQDKLHQDKSHQVKSHQDKPHQDKSHQDKSHQDKSHQDKSHQDKSHQDKSHKDKSDQDKSHQDKSHQDKSHQDKSHQDKSHQDNIDVKNEDLLLTDQYISEKLTQMKEESYFTMNEVLLYVGNILSNNLERIDDFVKIYLENSLPIDIQAKLNDVHGNWKPSTLFIYTSLFILFSIILFMKICKKRIEENHWDEILKEIPKVQTNFAKIEQEKLIMIAKLAIVQNEIEQYQIKSVEKNEEFSEMESSIILYKEEQESLKLSEVKLNEEHNNLTNTLFTKKQLLQSKVEEEKTLKKALNDSDKKAKDIEQALVKKQKEMNKVIANELNVEENLQTKKQDLNKLHTSKGQLQTDIENWSKKARDLEKQKESLKKKDTRTYKKLEFKTQELAELRQCYQTLRYFDALFSQVNNLEQENNNNEDIEVQLKNFENIKGKLKEYVDLSLVTSKLKSTKVERDSLHQALLAESDTRKVLEDNIQTLKSDFDHLALTRQNAEQSAKAAALKMEILSNYFKEKEEELNRQLTEKENKDMQSSDQLLSNSERIKQQELLVKQYKLQVDELQEEIQKVEANFRKEISLQEKQAHDNWLIFRQSERETKEYKNEAQIIKTKIHEIQTKLGITDGRSSPKSFDFPFPIPPFSRPGLIPPFPPPHLFGLGGRPFPPPMMLPIGMNPRIPFSTNFIGGPPRELGPMGFPQSQSLINNSQRESDFNFSSVVSSGLPNSTINSQYNKAPSNVHSSSSNASDQQDGIVLKLHKDFSNQSLGRNSDQY